MVIDSINHEGTGDFATKIRFGNKSTAKITLDMDKVNYMQNVLDIRCRFRDRFKSKYTFKEKLQSNQTVRI
jgi:hypothetical protein